MDFPEAEKRIVAPGPPKKQTTRFSASRKC